MNRAILNSLRYSSKAPQLQQPEPSGVLPETDKRNDQTSLLHQYLGLASPDQYANIKSKDSAPSEFEATENENSDPVFICVDLEAFERNQRKITEIGIATLDFRDLRALPLAQEDQGWTWLEQIKSSHLRIEEYKRLVNRKFVKGCPNKFNFGTSRFVRLKNVRMELLNAFTKFPGPRQNSVREQRNVILVGHGIASDLTYLKRLSFNPYKEAKIIHTFDTQALLGSKKRQMALKKLLWAVDISPKNLHNGGNDATYTLQALVHVAIQQLFSPDSLQARVQEVQSPPPPSAVKIMAAKVAKKARKAKRAAEIAQKRKQRETDGSEGGDGHADVSTK